ncbi:MAG: prepilin-type N-terminal cleavage/methylation domain-containing protein [Ruminococcus sp.]|nr:prepilin-type N-terminal cleavage/methylation domain-containing protein [Ruminococcus sp.]
MKKILKAFTLIELVIVMAIMTILLAGILQLFAPVRVAYAETAALESKRANCNSITKYMTESLRYAQFIGVYQAGVTGADTETKAADAANKLFGSITANAATLKLSAADLTAIESKIQVIVIDYSESTETTYQGQEYSGRLFRYKNTSPANFHMSFGKAYYGNNDFGINVKLISNSELSVVASTQGFNNGGGEVDASNEIVTTSGSVLLGNFVSGAGGKFYSVPTDDAKKADGDAGQDGIADFLQDIGTTSAGGTLASGANPQYFFAFIPAEDMPN